MDTPQLGQIGSSKMSIVVGAPGLPTYTPRCATESVGEPPGGFDGGSESGFDRGVDCGFGPADLQPNGSSATVRPPSTRITAARASALKKKVRWLLRCSGGGWLHTGMPSPEWGG